MSTDFAGYKKLNSLRNRVTLVKQNLSEFYYRSVEVISNSEIVQHAILKTNSLNNVFINSQNDFCIRETATGRAGYELVRFNKDDGEVIEVVKTMGKIPMHFFSPAFDKFISIEDLG